MSEPVVQAHPLGPLHSRTSRLGRDVDLLDFAGDSGFVWRSAGLELVTKGVAARVQAVPAPDRLLRTAENASLLLGAIEHDSDDDSGLGPLAVGALPFDRRARGELVVPELILRRDADGECWETRITRPGADRALLGVAEQQPAVPPPPVRGVHAEMDRRAWDRMIELALAAIHAGDVGKVVLARRLFVEAERAFDRVAVLRRLRDRADGSFLYAHDTLVGASPELLVRREGTRVTSTPLAGTVPRGQDASQEQERIASLVNSAKEAEEHRYVVDGVVSVLESVAKEVTAHPREVARLATVSHLATRIDARLPESGSTPSALTLAALLHPTPAVGGTPTGAALRLQARLEPFERGRYGGPVGWVNAAGDGEWAIALRGAKLEGNRARLVAGVGVVDGSEPGTEWAETEAKFDAMLGVLSAG